MASRLQFFVKGRKLKKVSGLSTTKDDFEPVTISKDQNNNKNMVRVGDLIINQLSTEKCVRGFAHWSKPGQ